MSNYIFRHVIRCIKYQHHYAFCCVWFSHSYSNHFGQVGGNTVWITLIILYPPNIIFGKSLKFEQTQSISHEAHSREWRLALIWVGIMIIVTNIYANAWFGQVEWSEVLQCNYAHRQRCYCNTLALDCKYHLQLVFPCNVKLAGYVFTVIDAFNVS